MSAGSSPTNVWKLPKTFRSEVQASNSILSLLTCALNLEYNWVRRPWWQDVCLRKSHNTVSKSSPCSHALSFYTYERTLLILVRAPASIWVAWCFWKGILWCWAGWGWLVKWALIISVVVSPVGPVKIWVECLSRRGRNHRDPSKCSC